MAFLCVVLRCVSLCVVLPIRRVIMCLTRCWWVFCVYACGWVGGWGRKGAGGVGREGVSLHRSVYRS